MSEYISNGESALAIRNKLNSSLLVPAEAADGVLSTVITTPDNASYIYFVAPSNYSSKPVDINGARYTLMSQYNVKPVDAWSEGGIVKMFLDNENKIAYVEDVPCYTKQETLASSTPALFGLSASSTPDAVFRKIPTLIDEKASVAYGSYTGSGTVGQSHPNKILASFPPYIVGIYDPDASIPSIIIRGQSSFYTWTGYDSGGKCDVTFSGNNVSWYCTTDFRWDGNNSAGYYSNEPFLQLNTQGKTYNYFIIGR